MDKGDSIITSVGELAPGELRGVLAKPQPGGAWELGGWLAKGVLPFRGWGGKRGPWTSVRHHFATLGRHSWFLGHFWTISGKNGTETPIFGFSFFSRKNQDIGDFFPNFGILADLWAQWGPGNFGQLRATSGNFGQLRATSGNFGQLRATSGNRLFQA